jgi:ribosome biogenesis protein BRX1
MSSSTKKVPGSVAAAERKAKKTEGRDMSKYINKQRTLVFASRGIKHRDRHLLQDLRDLLPHSKKEAKLDSKDQLFIINEVAEMKSCNNVLYFETRKKKDLYMWMSRIPNGPSVKFLIQNVHTMAEVKMTGNCLKGSRPLLVFDKTFDTEPSYKLLKEMFSQVMGSPKGHPNTKPFIDHVFSFSIVDDRIWFRNYQIVYEVAEKTGESDTTRHPVLVEIGPRFVMNPVRIFAGSFGGATLWTNPKFVSPNQTRALLGKRKNDRYDERQDAKSKRSKYVEDNAEEEDDMDTVFQLDQ